MTNTSRTYFYARVSTQAQSLDRQLEAFKAIPDFNENNLITDKATGKDFDRPGYQHLKQNLLRAGDTLVIKELDRLGRNKTAILAELNWMRENGIRVKVLDIPTTCIEIGDEMKGSAWILDMISNILVEVLSSVAQHELEHRAQRQAEGMAAMKRDENGKLFSERTGRNVGKPPKARPADYEEITRKWQEGKISGVEAALRLGVGRTTYYKWLREDGLQK